MGRWKGLSCAPGINSKESSCIASRHFSVVEAYPKDNVNTDSFGTDMKNRSLVESKYDLCLLFFCCVFLGRFVTGLRRQCTPTVGSINARMVTYIIYAT